MKYRLSFFKSLGILMMVTALYFSIKKHGYSLESWIFCFLNDKLLSYRGLQYIFALLSHKHESWINVIVMLLINILSIVLIQRSGSQEASLQINRNRAINICLYCWLSFQVILLLNNLIFQKWLQINRSSPGVIYTSIRLSEIFNNHNIKDLSHNSFPAGHALVIMYWLLFLHEYANRSMQIIALITGILLVFPRMVTGAHWVSDIGFSLLLGWVYFNLAMWFGNHYENIRTRIH